VHRQVRDQMTADPAVNNHAGQRADSPGEIPLRGWRSILQRVYASLADKNVSILAAGVAFYGMLSIFPALGALLSVYGLMADAGTVRRQISEVHGIIPAEAQKLIGEYLQSITASSSAKLGLGVIAGVLIALWSARAGAVTLIQALNIVNEEKEKRGIIGFEAMAVAMTVVGILFGAMTLTLIAAVPGVLQFLALPKSLEFIGYVAPWPLLIALMSLGLAALYRFAPSRREPKWRWVSWGGVAATLLWIVASAGFSVYVGKFAHYDKTFGSLGAVVVLLTWFYLSAYVVLLGACLNAEMERQTARDTTHSPERPLGQRGAKMADTVAN
jgi:membrane protein